MQSQLIELVKSIPENAILYNTFYLYCCIIECIIQYCMCVCV